MRIFSPPASDQPQVGPHLGAEESFPGGGHALHGWGNEPKKCVKSRSLGLFSSPNRERPQRGGQSAGQQRNTHTINKVLFKK